MLRGEIRRQISVDALTFDMDSWIARSTLQKAIRRNLPEMAMGAGLLLLEQAAPVFWRRMLVTAIEDLGAHNINLIGQTVLAARGKRQRSKIGTDADIACALIGQACDASKCQAANELRMIVEYDPALTDLRSRYGRWSERALIRTIMAEQNDHLFQAMAIVELTQRRALESISEVCDSLGAIDDADAFTIICEAHRRLKLSLSACAAIVCSSGGLGGDTDTVDERAPDWTWISGAPSFALDQYTRSGLRAIGRYVQVSDKWQRLKLSRHMSKRDQRSLAAEILFRIEGAAVDRRRQWVLGSQLRESARYVGLQIPTKLIVPAFHAVRSDIELVNILRAQEYRGFRT